MNPTEIQNKTVQEKYSKRLELEKLRHQNIMIELEFMSRHKITKFDRMELRK